MDFDVARAASARRQSHCSTSKADELPATQPIDDRVLKDVVAYIEVRCLTENRTRGIAKQIEMLGATVMPKFTNDVTHVVFKGGNRTTQQRALKLGVYLVSVLWVESCRQNQTHMSENLYPVASPGKSTPIVGRLRKMKSMQPKEFDEEVARSADRQQRRQRMRNKKNMREFLFNTPEQGNSPLFVAETQPRRSADAGSDVSLSVPDTPTYVQQSRLRTEIMQRLRAGASSGDSSASSAGDATRQDSVVKSPAMDRLNNVSPVHRKLFRNPSARDATKRPRCDSDDSGTVSHGSSSSDGEQAAAGRVSPGGGRPPVKPSKKKRKLWLSTQEPSSKLCTPHETSRAEVSGSEIMIGGKKRAGKPARPAWSRRNDANSTSTVIEILKTVMAPTRTSLEEFKPSAARKPRRSAEKSSAADGSDVAAKQRRSGGSTSSQSSRSSSIVMTSLHASEQELVIAIVGKLGRFRLRDDVGCDTTHVVCGRERRTLNALAAIARGCWIVSVSWVLESLETGAWLAETPYECVAWFPAARLACAEREAAGGGDSYRQAVFARCGRVHVGNTDAPEEKMVNLLQQCGAEVTACHRKADVCVGGRTSNQHATHVTEKWVFDSITAHEAQPLARYAVTEQGRSASPEF